MAAGSDSYSIAVLEDQPTGYWQLSELPTQNPNNFAFDSTGNGSQLVYGANVTQCAPCLLNTRGTAPHNGATAFPQNTTVSAANGILSPGRIPILEPAAGTFITVECWVQPQVIIGGATQVMVEYGSSTNSSYVLSHTGSTSTNHQFVFNTFTGAGSAVTAALPLLVAGTVYHVVGVYNGVSNLIYVNGVLQGTAAQTGNIQNYLLGLAFGLSSSLTASQALEGNLDEVAIYNKVLPVARIAFHYREGNQFLPRNWNQ